MHELVNYSEMILCLSSFFSTSPVQSQIFDALLKLTLLIVINSNNIVINRNL